MESVRQMGAAILLGFVSVLIVLGGFSLAMAEGGLATGAAQQVSPATNTPVSIIVTIFPTLPLPETATQQVALPNTDTPAPNFTATTSLTPPPTLTICPPPAGWVPVIVQPNDTLASLSLVYRTSAELLRTKNCLLNDQLVSGSVLYVPPLPTSTFVPCGAPAGWGYYTVVPGDTLYHISLLYRVTVQQLMLANCLHTSNINAGQVLRVPHVSTSTPSTPPVTDTSPAPTATEAASQPSPITEIPSSTATATDAPTATATPTVSSTP